MRDQFLFVVAGITGLFLIVIAAVGLNRDALEVAHWQPWIAYVLIMFLITNVSTYGMLFGLIFVEEVETRARAALMVAPIAPARLTLLRTSSVVIWLVFQPFLFAGLIAAAWQAVPFGLIGWFLICLSLAPLGAVFMIVLSTFASNRVEALALGKFFSIATTPPMLLYLLPPDAWYRHILLIFPTTPAVHGFEEFRAGEPGGGLVWLAWGFVYALALVVIVLRRFVRRSYQVDA